MTGPGTERPSSSGPGSSYEGTYAPGTMLLDRYRIVALIGEGGMGEVYLADDVRLGQEVALKFLPERIAQREGGIERFFSEVRIARTVTHPNVARVHDIQEVDGRHFLTMEYVDGEDLAHLLKRIGRLPNEKAVEIARQICAGLAAAHEAGVLHRDLKPANVMLDAEGKVRVTDFGLAALAEEQSEGQIVGTPAYMSPEQIAGRKVTARSEVYSLGLLLYELFTGKRVFEARTIEEFKRLHESQAPSTPSSLVADMDPAVERVILQCLEKAPEDRPASPRAVALALPGGDPLAAALAAGETPAAELVADAGERGGLAPPVAWGLLLSFLAGLALVVGLAPKTRLAQIFPIESSPAVLAERARAILADLGHEGVALDSTVGFQADRGQVANIAQESDAERWELAAAQRPSPIHFWYRQSPQYLVRWRDLWAGAGPFDPPHDSAGMVRMYLDSSGSLSRLSIIPPEYEQDYPDGRAAGSVPDWSLLFAAAELDLTRFEPSQPRWTPEVNTDFRTAWEGSYGDGNGNGGEARKLRVEAGAQGGKVVWFRTYHEWDEPPEEEEESAGGFNPLQLFQPLLALGVMLGPLLMARRNLRLGRCHRAGANRIALSLFLATILTWVFMGHHVPEFGAELWRFLGRMARASLLAAYSWCAYLALEPYLRKLWPHSLISWIRLLDGRLRDPMLGRDVLIGGLFGIAIVLLEELFVLAPAGLGHPPASPLVYGGIEDLYAMLGPRHGLAQIASAFADNLAQGFSLVVLLLLLRFLLRLQWLALSAFLVLMVLETTEEYFYLGIGVDLLLGILSVVAVFRFGLLPFFVGLFLSDLLGRYPLTFDLGSWYGGAALFGMLLPAAIGIWAFWIVLAGRPLFRDLLAD